MEKELTPEQKTSEEAVARPEQITSMSQLGDKIRACAPEHTIAIIREVELYNSTLQKYASR